MKRSIVACMFIVFGMNMAWAQKKKPNVVVIYTDDHRYTGVHALGGQGVKTPNLDKLAYEGIAFTNAYLQGSFSGATCVPSRAMLLTGRNLFDLDGQGRSIPVGHTTIGEAFKSAGYNTYMVGKWHQDNQSLARSFDDGATVMSRGIYLVDHFRMPCWDWKKDGDYKKEDGYLIVYDESGKEVRRPVTKEDKRGPTGTEVNGPHTSEIYSREAIKYIREYKSKKPFMMYLAFHAPHDPRQAPQKYTDMYPPGEIQLTPSYMLQHPFDNGHIVLRDEELAPWPRTPEIARQQLADYYSIISHLDDQIGKVVQELKASGQYENTIIVMAGDSGLAVGNHGLMGKQSIYHEDGIHIPFILSGGLVEEKNKGRREGALVYNYDIMPTLCDLAGIATPGSVTGKSLVPVIKGEKGGVRNHTYHAYRQHQRAYRKGDFKLIEYVRAPDSDKTRGGFVAGSRVTQLFNLALDPWETFNLADFPEYENTVEKLRKEMKNKAKEVGDVADVKRSEVDFWAYF
ncbi:MAG: sulfatase-like hydrolase/transferase [Cyclobacteriaceae bacterium]